MNWLADSFFSSRLCGSLYCFMKLVAFSKFNFFAAAAASAEIADVASEKLISWLRNTTTNTTINIHTTRARYRPFPARQSKQISNKENDATTKFCTKYLVVYHVTPIYTLRTVRTYYYRNISFEIRGRFYYDIKKIGQKATQLYTRIRYTNWLAATRDLPLSYWKIRLFAERILPTLFLILPGKLRYFAASIYLRLF